MFVTSGKSDLLFERADIAVSTEGTKLFLKAFQLLFQFLRLYIIPFKKRFLHRLLNFCSGHYRVASFQVLETKSG